ncbi:MAG: metallophosphoesterase [Bacteroidetes bacterium]|jgi:Icc-related predicted phosphoesterase|nr:metallophosphoesterase [Bacteroidota bacterium]
MIMKFIAISDTHKQHKSLPLPKGDVIIHAGDISSRGSAEEISEFLEWFRKLDYKYKLLIAGNHDFLFEREPEKAKELIPPEVIYLENNDVVIEGIKIWGSPITPWFYDWAFNRHRGEDIIRYWQKIPSDTDIVITHGPAYGILDKTVHGQHVGCEDLLKRVKDIKPKFHVCGHIHEGYGQEMHDGTTFINASVLDHRYKRKNSAIEFITDL